MTEASRELRGGLSTTRLMSLAAAGVAVLAIVAEPHAFTPTDVIAALVGLVPWALVAAGVDVPPWLFALVTVPAGVVMVVVAENSGGMFPLILVLVWLIRSSRSLVLAIATAAAACTAISVLAWDKGVDESGIFYFTAGVGVSALCGAMLRRQEALTAQLEAMRDEQVARIAATERAHLAREVHDVVAHSLTVVMLNLTGARRALATDPDRADEALARAEVVGRDSLDSIRQVMDLLREPGVAGLPQPALDGIPRLVEGYRSAGLDVDLTIDGDCELVDSTVELVGYRVVQESLANVLQHAPGAAASVTLAFDADGVAVTIRNGAASSSPAPRPPRAGLGTMGMAERVRAAGGTFEAGPTAEHGWLVAAWLPARRRHDADAVDVPVGRG